MIFTFTDVSDPADLRRAFDAVTDFLLDQSVTDVSGLWLNSVIFSGPARLQVRRGHEVTHVEVRPTGDGTWTAVPLGDVVPRFVDEPFHPLATLFDHDD